MLLKMRFVFLLPIVALISALCTVNVQGGLLPKILDKTVDKILDKTLDEIFLKNAKWMKWLDRRALWIKADRRRRERLKLEKSRDGLIFFGEDIADRAELIKEPGVEMSDHHQKDLSVVKRDTGSSAISRSSSPNRVDLVERVGGRRKKRSAHYVDNLSWSNNIPYVIDSSYSSVSNGFYVPILKRVFRWMSQRICVTFHDETDNYDPNNSTWWTENGYDHDAYINVIDGSGCSASRGWNGKTGPVNLSPCYGFQINVHEVFHTLGGSHMQQIPIRDNYMVVNDANINPDLLDTYSKNGPSDFYTENFDPDSTLLYGPVTWNDNNLETYFLMRGDDMNTDTVISSEEIMVKEINKVYGCNEMFCNNDTTDCGPGYHTLRNGVCGCVCPRMYDPATNCQTLIDKPTTDTWPDLPLVLFKAGGNTPCPDGFEPGWFTHEGIWKDLQKPQPDLFNASGKITYFETCRLPGPSNPDWEKMPVGGSYCIIKEVGVDCGFGEEAVFNLTSKSTVETFGPIGDITADGVNITMKYCCSYQAHLKMILDLPSKVPFRLISKSDCPIVRGMREYKALVDFYTTDKSVGNGLLPSYWIFAKELQFQHCYYQPAVYGCHEEFDLSATTPSATVTTPGYNSSAREPDRRCFKIFHAPEGARLRLTFEDYDLDVDDKMLIQISNAWQEPKRVDNSNYPYQILSEGNHLYTEYWAGYATVSNRGVKFTVDVLLAEDSCYDVNQNGADYLGGTSISEQYEKCISWAEAANCDDFPYQTVSGVSLLTTEGDASCRNPDGNLLGPWCYTYVNDTVCRRRYCDACNYKAPVDVLKNCADLIAADGDFCDISEQRFGCFASCGFQQQHWNRSTCGTPTIPSDAEPVEALKSLYYEGERVLLRCSDSSPDSQKSEMVCRKTGWTQLAFACNECPAGWVPYNDRCFMIFTDKMTADDAAAECRAQAHSGTFFRIHDEAEQTMMRDYKESMGSPYDDSMWISGHLFAEIPNEDVGDWRFTDDETTSLPYTNWTAAADPNDESKTCANYKGLDPATMNGWRAKPCDDSSQLYRFACQVDRHEHGCSDKIGGCDTILAQFPHFCQDPNSIDKAEETCYKSCGLCDENNQCTEPIALTYSRTSSQGTINPGDVMTFACNMGMYHVGGDLKRACSSSGQLLGQEPECSMFPVTQDINRSSLRPRLKKLRTKLGYLLDHNGLRVPFNGNITQWHYYCDSTGEFYAFVFRKNGASYNFIGSNLLSCDARWPWTYSVPTQDRISVIKDDIVGFYTLNANTVYTSECDGATSTLMVIPRAGASDFETLKTASFSAKECLIPSFGYQVTP